MSAVQRWLLHVSTLLVVVSGAATAVMKYLMVGNDPYSAVGHPLQPWALSLHVLAGPAAIFAVGLIFREHVVGRMRQQNGGGGGAGRASGLGAAALLLPMIASGTMIQVVTSEGLRAALVVIHLVSGGLYTLSYTAHLIRSRLLARSSSAETGPKVCPVSHGEGGPLSMTRAALGRHARAGRRRVRPGPRPPLAGRA